MNYEYVIGVSKKLWTIPTRMPFEEVVDHVTATPDPLSLTIERCGGVCPNADRGSIWWWVSC